LTIKYLRRESFSFYPTLLSKIAITADQKALRATSQGFGDRKVPDPLQPESCLIRATRAGFIDSLYVDWWS